MHQHNYPAFFPLASTLEMINAAEINNSVIKPEAQDTFAVRLLA